MRALAIAVLLLLAGCAAPSSTSTHHDETSHGHGRCTSDTGCEPREDAFTLRLDVHVVGPFVLDVPTSTGSWCLQTQAWKDALQSETNARVDVMDADMGRTGQVLRITGSDNSLVVAKIPTATLARCETFRYDPWSIDPDVTDGIEMKAEGNPHVVLVLSDGHGDCWTSTEYQGSVGPDWTRLAAKDSGTVCA